MVGGSPTLSLYRLEAGCKAAQPVRNELEVLRLEACFSRKRLIGLAVGQKGLCPVYAAPLRTAQLRTAAATTATVTTTRMPTAMRASPVQDKIR